jgi:hypothetical protein
MASNYYGQQDSHITKALNDMHARLRSGMGGGSFTAGFHDHYKPALDYGELPPLKIKGVQESQKNFDIHGSPKK